MQLESGILLKHYRLAEKIGEGGMGVVWRATDTVLERDVAIKVLPALFASDQDRLARFEREARALAALNHPGIGAIYGLETHEDVRFLVLELVPGETLRDRLRRGPLELREALRFGRQVAEALEAAHDGGILHRDLKPANVKVTPDGKVKVLDFGLAKSIGASGPSSDHSLSPTVTSMGTDAGMILGTAAYMSPEQARGQALDRRSDIWSFGCLLYQAMTGESPFAGRTTTDILARVLERDPDWDRLGERTPPRLRSLIRRCLQKEPERRLRDIGDARLEIEELLEPGAEPAERPPSTVRSAGRSMALLLLCLLAGALGTWALMRSGPATSGSDLRLAEVARVTHDTGLSEWPTWSPDGTALAFASDRTGNFDIFVRRVAGGQEVNVTGNPGQDFQPAFSPDGDRIAFISTRSSRTGMIKIGSQFGMEFRTLGGDLWLVPALGGPARRLAPDANYPSWSPDGARVAYVSGPEEHRSILEISADGSHPVTVLDSRDSTWEIVRIQHSPSGRWISFESLDGQVFLIPAAGGEPVKLMDAYTHAWDPGGGRIFTLRRDPLGGSRLEWVAVDEENGRLRGKPRTLSLMTGTLRDLAIAPDSRQLAVSELEGSLNLTLLPLNATGGGPSGPERVLSTGRVIDRYPSFSPDGRRIAYSSDRLGSTEIWILDLATGERQLLQLPGAGLGANGAYWSPDGTKVSVTRYLDGGRESVWLAALDGSSAEEILPPSPGLVASQHSPDGREILYALPVDDLSQLFALDLSTGRSRQITDTPWDTFEGIWSPDGRTLVVVSNRGGSVQLWTMPPQGGEARPLTSGDERVRHASFSPDGRWVYFQPSHRNIYRVPTAGGPVEAVTDFPESGLFMEEPTLSPDGRTLAYCRSHGGSSLWVLTLEGGERTGS